jgi:hypothetical protein
MRAHRDPPSTKACGYTKNCELQGVIKWIDT